MSDAASNEEHPHTFIQWKGTKVCMDLYCPNCQAHGHIDDDFVYTVRCKHCNTTYSVGQEVKLTIITEEGVKGTWLENWFKNPIVFEDDDRPGASHIVAHRPVPSTMLTVTELDGLLTHLTPSGGYRLSDDDLDVVRDKLRKWIKEAQ